jgi:CheY-like chemotaxis protein
VAGRGDAMEELADFSRAVVVVDDDAEMRSTLQELLELQGYRVLTAGNGHEAIKLMSQKGAPALLILDLRMPVMTGRQLLDLLQRHEVLREIPVVTVSATPEACPPEGVQACLLKPFQMSELMDVVRQHCR